MQFAVRLLIVALVGVLNCAIFDGLQIWAQFGTAPGLNAGSLGLYASVFGLAYFGFGALTWGLILFRQKSLDGLVLIYIVSAVTLLPTAYFAANFMFDTFTGAGQGWSDYLITYAKYLIMMAANILISLPLIKALQIGPGQKFNA